HFIGDGGDELVEAVAQHVLKADQVILTEVVVLVQDANLTFGPSLILLTRRQSVRSTHPPSRGRITRSKAVTSASGML
ncbi:MAG: hypothetical protein QOG73_2456, partial [Acetobacteraceae bacterium]|nr:hypothetical protein [Acetobacteraceae bacterium]